MNYKYFKVNYVLDVNYMLKSLLISLFIFLINGQNIENCRKIGEMTNSINNLNLNSMGLYICLEPMDFNKKSSYTKNIENSNNEKQEKDENNILSNFTKEDSKNITIFKNNSLVITNYTNISQTPSFLVSSPSSISSPSPTFYPSPILSPSPTFYPSPILSPSPTYHPSPILSPSPTYHPSPILSPSPNFHPSPVFSPTPTSNPSPVFSPSPTYHPSPVFTPSPTFYSSPIYSPSSINLILLDEHILYDPSPSPFIEPLDTNYNIQTRTINNNGLVIALITLSSLMSIVLLVIIVYFCNKKFKNKEEKIYSCRMFASKTLPNKTNEMEIPDIETGKNIELEKKNGENEIKNISLQNKKLKKNLKKLKIVTKAKNNILSIQGNPENKKSPRMIIREIDKNEQKLEEKNKENNNIASKLMLLTNTP